MSFLYIPVGISGSGKTHLKRSLKTIKISVCPDDIRKELTGNIGDQSRNNEVFRIAYSRIKALLSQDKSVYFDGTNLRRDTIDTLLSIAKETGATPQIFILKDSENIELCRDRVRKDILSGVDRSDTSKVEMGIQERQQKAYYNILPYLYSLEDVKVFEF